MTFNEYVFWSYLLIGLVVHLTMVATSLRQLVNNFKDDWIVTVGEQLTCLYINICMWPFLLAVLGKWSLNGRLVCKIKKQKKVEPL